jgi:quinoprotein dehydrogenase-associated probable ABC transporter substrate-binding protein
MPTPSVRRSRRVRAGLVLTAMGIVATMAGAVWWQAPPRAFRVCADPNNLPFSNRAQAGFENRIAQLFARDLGDTLTYDWLAQSRGFARKTLGTGECDVIMGVPAHDYDPVMVTKPYYSSTYVFVYRADRGWHITSFDDTLLKHVKIGIHLTGGDNANPPPAMALAARGIIDNVEGFPIIGDYAQPNPPARLIDAVANGTVDVAIVWGPLAGYFAPREPVKLTIQPVTPHVDASGVPFVFDIAMGVRKGDTARVARLDSLIDRERQAIHRILEEYGVPLVGPEDTAVSSRRR